MISVQSRLVLFLVIFSESVFNICALREFTVDGEETILAFENENIHIQCQSDLPINYCGFISPSGKRYSFTESIVNDGKCMHKIKAKLNDSGEWKCHIGMKTIRLETIKKIQVRIVSQLAAIQPNITSKYGKSVTISCATTKGFVPLSYCRFEPPNGKSFNIDESVDVKNAILGKYYYPSNRSLDRGDCAVTIAKVRYEDAGVWTCGAGFEDGNEYTDMVMIEVEGMYSMSTASATGVTFGALLVVVTLASLGYAAWKKRRILAGAPPAEEIEIQDLGQRARRATSQENIPVVQVQSPSEPSASPLLPSP